MSPTARIAVLASVLLAVFTSGFAQGSPAGGERVFKRSLDVDLLASYSYRENFGLGSSAGALSYSPMLTYNFLLDEHNALGIVLLKFNHYPLADNPVYNFAYGFQFKHFWNRKWADLGAFVPWLSYAILLNQTLVAGESGRVIGHNTRLSLGSDIVLAPSHRLVPQLAWDSVDYPGLNGAKSYSLSSLSLGLGYRLLF